MKLQNDTETPRKRNLGRPSSSFTASSNRTKRRKTEDILSHASVEQLSYATQMSLRASGKLDAAKVVSDVILGSPSKAQKYRRSLEFTPESILSADSALSLIIEQKLSKSQYQGLQTISIENNCKLYPSYKTVEAKRKCYPLRSGIIITECSAKIKLQLLLDHTAERILLA